MQNRSRLHTSIILLLLFLAAWVPRTLALDVFVTPDERKWLTRSVNFSSALVHGEYERTFQTIHPGVTVMWAGALGMAQQAPGIAPQIVGQPTEKGFEIWLDENNGPTPLDLLTAGRWWVALAISLGIALAFLPLRALFGAHAAILATLLMAWDPFFLALSRQIHIDGLLTTLISLSLLTLLAWLYAGRRKRYLVASAFFLALAALTKTPAILLGPAALLLFTLEWAWPADQGKKRDASLIWGFLAWGALSLVVYTFLWPAMWTDPLGMPVKLISSMVGAAGGHELPNYFMGAPTYNPGPAFYPLAFLFRTTPIVLAGLILAAIFALFRRWPLDKPARRRSALGLLLFALIFVVGLTAGAKKFDRYSLPIYPAMDILAALGLIGAVRWLTVRRRTSEENAGSPRGRWALLAALLLAGLIAIQGLLGFMQFPYYLTYYNPLLGGARMAERVLLVGWGEGLESAAAWLNQQPEKDALRVVSWYDAGPTSYFLDPAIDLLSYSEPDFWIEADYAVVYINQRQRDIPSPEAIAYFAALEPVYTVSKNGLDLARVYAMRGTTPPPFTGIRRQDAVFDNGMRLAGYQTQEPSALPGDDVPLTLFLEKIAPGADHDQASLQLIDADGALLWEETRWPAGVAPADWPLNEIWQDPYEIAIPADAPPGDARLTLTFRDPDGGQARHLIESDQPRDGNDGYTVATIQVQLPQEQPVSAEWGTTHLTSLRHQRALTPDERLVTLMTATGETDGSLKLSARLVDGDGNVVAQADAPLTPAIRLELPLPEDAAPGLYQLAVVVYDPTTLDPLPDASGSFSTVISTVEVQEEPAR